MWMCIYISLYELNSDILKKKNKKKNLFVSGPLEVILKDNLRKLLDYSSSISTKITLLFSVYLKIHMHVYACIICVSAYQEKTYG